MSTAAQKRANEQNAQYSTGPRTEEGKQRSSLNALKHGFCAKDPLIRGEDPDDYLRHGAELELSLAPVTPVEQDLVEQIIDITWRLKRFQRIESSIINDLYDAAAEQPSSHDKDQNEVLGNALSRQGCLDSLSRISRYESNLRRHYHNALKELRTIRKASRQADLFHRVSAGLSSRRGAAPKAELHAEPHSEPPGEENGDAEQAPATERDYQNADLTQSVVTLLESIAPMKNEDGQSDPSDLPIAEALQFYAETPAQAANQEAAK